jgi:hypothetical protein
MAEERACHTEHMLWKCWVGPHNTEGTKLFRAPAVLDGSGTHRRLPHQVGWGDLKVGDLVIALLIDTAGSGPEVIFVLQFWRVLEVEEERDSVRVEINNIVGSAADGEFVYDRIAGLVGAPPSVRE